MNNKDCAIARIVSLCGIALMATIAGCAHVSDAVAPRAARLPELLEMPVVEMTTLREQPDALYLEEDGDDMVTLNALIEAAFRSNPELQADLAGYEGRLQRIPQETSLPDPTVQMKLAYSSGGIVPREKQFPAPAVQLPGTQSMQSATAYTLQVVQPIPWPERLRLKGALAGQEAEIAFETHNTRLLDILHETTRQYHILAFEYAALALVREEKRYVAQYLDATAAGYVVGRHGRQAVLKAQTELVRLDKELLAFQGRIESSRAALRAAIGDLDAADALLNQGRVPPLGDIDIVLPDITPRDLAARAMALLPEAMRLDRQIEIGQLAQSLAREDYRPDFSIGLEYMNSAASSMSMNASGRRDTVGLMAGFTVPLPNARRRAQLAEARLMEKEARYRKQALAANTAAALEGAFERLYSLTEQIMVYGDGLIPLARETYETSRAEYEMGIGDYLNLLDALRVMLRLYQEELELKRDYLLLLADVQRITGARLVFQQRSGPPDSETLSEETRHE